MPLCSSACPRRSRGAGGGARAVPSHGQGSCASRGCGRGRHPPPLRLMCRQRGLTDTRAPLRSRHCPTSASGSTTGLRQSRDRRRGRRSLRGDTQRKHIHQDLVQVTNMTMPHCDNMLVTHTLADHKHTQKHVSHLTSWNQIQSRCKCGGWWASRAAQSRPPLLQHHSAANNHTRKHCRDQALHKQQLEKQCTLLGSRQGNNSAPANDRAVCARVCVHEV